jgi:hypothetical protein
LKTLTIPLGSGTPNLLDLSFENSILLAALSLGCEYPPELIKRRLYFLILTLKDLGINSTCF